MPEGKQSSPPCLEKRCKAVCRRKSRQAIAQAGGSRSGRCPPVVYTSLCSFSLGRAVHRGYVNDPFGVISFLWHDADLLNRLFTTLDLDQETQAGSAAALSFNISIRST